MSYSRLNWLRPLYILRPENEGYMHPPALFIFGRRPLVMQRKYDKQDFKSYVVPLNHRYFLKINLWLVQFETSFVYPKLKPKEESE